MKNKKGVVIVGGNGVVGVAMKKMFPEALCYDVIGNSCTKEEANTCELAIVCVPTPMKIIEGEEFSQCDTSIVESCVAWIETDYILIKSTVEPQTTDNLIKKYNKKIGFSPEYIGMSSYQITPWKFMDKNDPRLHDFLIIGAEPATAERITEIFVNKLGFEKKYHIVSAVEAELIKYLENTHGAMEVSFYNQYYELCKALGASWIKVREGHILDNRVNPAYTAVFVDNRGFFGRCFGKDSNAIVHKAEKLNVDLSILKSAIRKNREIRPKNEGEC